MKNLRTAIELNRFLVRRAQRLLKEILQNFTQINFD